jgi:hypothetical protein
MNRSFNRRLDALDRKFTDLEPNPIVLALRAILGPCKSSPDRDQPPAFWEAMRQSAINALKRASLPSSFTSGILQILEDPIDCEDDPTDPAHAPKAPERDHRPDGPRIVEEIARKGAVL